jgi:hypothetical protein
MIRKYGVSFSGMRSRRLVLAGTVAALAAGPVILAGSAAATAAATPPYSVAVEHCGGGIAIVGYHSLHAASRADNRAVHRQHKHPGVLKTVRLFQGRHAIRVSSRHC